MSAPKEQNETPNRRARAGQKPAASVNMDELRELITLLRDNGLAELELENEGFRVRLRRDSGVVAAAPITETPIATPPPAPVRRRAPHRRPRPPRLRRLVRRIPAPRRPRLRLKIRTYTLFLRPSSVRFIVRRRRPRRRL